VTVNAPDAKTSFKNLLGGPLARWWTEESASRLQRRIPADGLRGSAGARRWPAINDVAAEIPNQEWLPIAKEFFLS
jgi:hypothetical protein